MTDPHAAYLPESPLCWRPRFKATGQGVANYPWYLRPQDDIRCACGRPTCADVTAKPDPYWLPDPIAPGSMRARRRSTKAFLLGLDARTVRAVLSDALHFLDRFGDAVPEKEDDGGDC